LDSAKLSAGDAVSDPSADQGDVRQLRFDPIHSAKKSIISRRATYQYPAHRHLVFDVGGTNTRAAVYDEQCGVLVRRLAKPTPNHRRNPDLGPLEILSLLKSDMDDLATELLGEVAPQKISVAFAGPLDGNQMVVAAPTIWGTTSHPPIDLVSELQTLWPSPTIHVINDVTASGYRHLRHANENLCVITVGSGIGNKVFVDGKPLTGINGRGGEIGHIVVDHSDDALQCDCGGRGHLGAGLSKETGQQRPSWFFVFQAS
jgi:glucokinase